MILGGKPRCTCFVIRPFLCNVVPGVRPVYKTVGMCISYGYTKNTISETYKITRVNGITKIRNFFV